MPDPTYVTIPDLTAATDGSINDNLLLEAAVPDGGSYVSRKVTKGQLVADLKSELENISGISDDVKVALLDCFAHVAWTSSHGQVYYDLLEQALYAEEPKTLVSISAVYTQSGTVYDTDTLDSLKTDLVVTATWSDTSTSTVASADYTLSGTLTEGKEDPPPPSEWTERRTPPRPAYRREGFPGNRKRAAALPRTDTVFS